jgi:CBS domain-containing protein
MYGRERMRIKEIMTTDVCSCSPEDTLQAAAAIMWEKDVGCFPLVDRSERVVGVITDRDVCMLAYRRQARLDQLRAKEAVSMPLHTCRPDDTVREVEILMSMNMIRRLPVVDDQGRLCGMLSLNDIARAAPMTKEARQEPGLEAKHVAATLAAVSTHQPNPGSSKSD